MKIKGNRIIHEHNIEVEISPREVYESLKQHVYNKHDIRYDAYLDSSGKPKWDEEYHTSHYSCYPQDYEVTDEQLEILQVFDKLKKLI